MTQLSSVFAEACCAELRDQRKRLNLRQDELSRRSGLARSYICDVERGARMPCINNLSILADSLDYRMSNLFTKAEFRMAGQIDPRSLQNGQKTEVSDKQKDLIAYFDKSRSQGLVVADEEGNFLHFSPEATRLTGVGSQERPPDEWSDVFGLFLPDRVTPFPSLELPLVRAISGEIKNDVRMFIKNSMAPTGRQLVVDARPLQDDSGRITGALCVFWEDQ